MSSQPSPPEDRSDDDSASVVDFGAFAFILALLLLALLLMLAMAPR